MKNLPKNYACSDFQPLRRDFLFGLSATLGTVAFNSIAHAEKPKDNPLTPKPQHHPAKAKNCIFLFMEGGPSHIDTFDPKPKLKEMHLKEFVRKDQFVSAMASGKRYYIKSPFEFKQHGQSGMWMSEHFEQLSNVADDLCVYRGCVGESINHPTACYHMNTGNRFGGDPAMGSWVSYGLGTENQNLPSFVVLPELNYPQGGSANWSNGFLPAYFQGTPLRSQGSPILDLNPPDGVTEDVQRKNLDLLKAFNERDIEHHPNQSDLAARMESYELAFRMQAEVPGIIDIENETESIKEMYGIGTEPTDSFGRRCLLSRKLIENGVRFVQLYASGWDSHDYLDITHANRIRSVDRPIAALIQDLKQRGLLEDTLIIWAGEFGRSADNGLRGGAQTAGRDHNNKAMSILLAGGGVKAGHAIGETDELGQEAVDTIHPISDLHVTLLHLLGLNDDKLTYFHEGRFKQISQTGGKLIPELIA